MTIYSLDILLSVFGTRLLFHVQFLLLLPDLHIGFSRGGSGGLVFPSLSEFSTVYVIRTVKGFGIVNKAEIVVLLEFFCFVDDPADVGNLISGLDILLPILNHSTLPSLVSTCFLTCMQVSQEASQVVWYSHLFQNFPVCCDPHSQRLWHSQ